jgi:hypothetical protein
MIYSPSSNGTLLYIIGPGDRDGVPPLEGLLEAQLLFPFPRTFCDNMDLPEATTRADEVSSMHSFAMSDDGLLHSMGLVLSHAAVESSPDI